MSIKLLKLKTKTFIVRFDSLSGKRKKARASSISYAHITWHKCLFGVKLRPPGGMCFYEKQYFTMSKKYLFGVGN